MGLQLNISQSGLHNKKDLVSDELLEIVHTVNLAVLGACNAVFGIIANVLNIIVFVKQGLNDTVNIGLFGLAVSDLCSLITLGGMCFFRNPLIFKGLPVIAEEVQHLIACWPHALFARITSTMTVYITLERCLCVVIPLKVKSVITPRMTTSVVAGIFVVMIATVIPEYATCYLGWKSVPEQNHTLLGLILFPGKYEISTMNFYLAVGTQVASFVALVVFTVILIVKLKEKSKWRQSVSNSSGSSTKDTNTKDNKTVKMIALVAFIYCICFLPMLCCFTAVAVVPGFIGFGTYSNTYFFVWSFAFLFDSINSSVNIFIYYSMSTKFRTTFLSMFCPTSDHVASKQSPDINPTNLEKTSHVFQRNLKYAAAYS